MLYKELAEKIIKEVRKLLDEDIIVVDTNGIIMASTDPARINTFHEGALIASQKKSTLVISEEDQKILRGVKAGINLPIFFQGNVVGVIGITGTPEKVSPFGEIIRKMTELLISENYFSEQFDWESRSVESFLVDWITLKEWNEEFNNRAMLLDINTSINRQVMICEVNTDSSSFYRDFWLSVFSWNGRHKEDIISRWGSNRIIYVMASVQNKGDIRNKVHQFKQFLENQLSSTVYIGVGSVVPSSLLKLSFDQAKRALKACKEDQQIIFDEDLTLEMLIDEVRMQTREEFINRTIKPILSDQELITTLTKFFHCNGSLKETASTLHIHINTLHYRLKKIGELTKLNPRKLNDLLILYLAIQILDKDTKNDTN